MEGGEEKVQAGACKSVRESVFKSPALNRLKLNTLKHSTDGYFCDTWHNLWHLGCIKNSRLTGQLGLPSN